MKNNLLGIVNYGLGNIQSLKNALSSIDCKFCIIDEPTQIDRCTHLILPGVGAYGSAMASIENNGIMKLLIERITEGMPILGICLGMQLFFQESHEGGKIKGFGIFRGTVRSLKLSEGFKSLHTQWNQVHNSNSGNCALITNSFYYFTHRYAIYEPEISDFDELGFSEYSGHQFLSYAKKQNITLVQFHPENSGEIGLKFLKNYVR